MVVPADLDAVVAKLAAHHAWRALEPTSCATKLDPARTLALVAPEPRSKLFTLIAQDAALADEYAQLAAVAKAVLFARDFGRIVRNFVNFSDFYSKQDGLFQVGTLYPDARALHLCVPVIDAAKHAQLASSSDAMLVYCDITRGGQTQQIAAAITNGDGDNIFVGRNGVFYDRKDQDWDATVVKVVANPISIRQAFWAPYKKLVKVIEDNVTRRAQDANTTALGKIETAGGEIAFTSIRPRSRRSRRRRARRRASCRRSISARSRRSGSRSAGSAPSSPPCWARSSGSAPGCRSMVALLLLISGPSMLLAWLKLRQQKSRPDPRREWLGDQQPRADQRRVRGSDDRDREAAARRAALAR